MSEQVNKQSIIENNRSHDKDTGSSEVQIALLSARISHLTEHLKNTPKRFSFSSWFAHDGCTQKKTFRLFKKNRFKTLSGNYRKA